MSMHLVGPHMTTTNYSKRKSKKVSNKMRQAQEKHQMFLDSMGVGKRTELKGVDVVDNTYRRKQKLSNVICSNGVKKETPQLTAQSGIVGIVTTHKSNIMPIRKDNPQAAVDAANMRR